MKFSWQKEVKGFAKKEGFIYGDKKLHNFLDYSRTYAFTLKKANKILFLDFYEPKRKFDYYSSSRDLLKNQNRSYSYGVLCKSLDINIIKKLRLFGIGIYVYEHVDGVIEISPPDIGDRERKNLIENISKKIDQINTISSAKIGSKIFSITNEKDKKLLNKIISDISTKVYTQEDFTNFICALDLIMEMLNIKQLSQKCKSNFPKMQGSINKLVYIFMNCYNQPLPKDIEECFRTLKNLRVSYPVHKKEGYIEARKAAKKLGFDFSKEWDIIPLKGYNKKMSWNALSIRCLNYLLDGLQELRDFIKNDFR